MANKINSKPQTLCFKCATPSPTCPWKYNFTPVEGWEAEKTELKISKTSKYSTCESYIVKSCPLFEENVRTKEDNKNISKSPLYHKRYHISRGKQSI